MRDVLIVDDAPDVRGLVAALLEVEGIPHRIACHGGEALDQVRRTPPAVV
jgi:CheY-like chemotaxis protein